MQKPNNPNWGTAENYLSNNFSSTNLERSLADKVLSKEEVARLNYLLSKEDLEREEVLELVNLIIGNEAKLLNYNSNERYIQMKHFAWLGDFATLAETAFDYKARVEKGEIVLSANDQKILRDNVRSIVYLCKNSVRFFLYISRTSNSLSMAAFDAFTKSRYDYQYSQTGEVLPQADNQGFFSRLLRR